MKMEMKKDALYYGKAACDTLMRKFAPGQLPPCDKEAVPERSRFFYHQGVFLSGMQQIYDLCGEEKYLDYCKKWAETVIDEEGHILGQDQGSFSLGTMDFRQPGILLFLLYEKTGEERYRKALDWLVQTMKEYPVNSLGGFWHKYNSPNQMWLDGLYMMGPLLAQYAAFSGETAWLEESIRQAVIMYEHMKDPVSGLMFHAWDESRQASWADPITGLSSEIWGRAQGWFVVALMNILDYVPKEHPMRERLEEMERELLEAVFSYQGEDGRWYQIVNKPDHADNWSENSCSCLFVCAAAKAIRKGILPKERIPDLERGYGGIIRSLTEEADGDLLIPDVCIGTCLGDYDFYINRPRIANDLHGAGAFILMCAEVYRLLALQA